MVFPMGGGEVVARLPTSHRLRDGSVTLPLPSCSALSLGCFGIWLHLGTESWDGGASAACVSV